MTPDPSATIVTSTRMRAIEAAAIASGSVTGSALMERAGAAALAAILAHWPELAADPARAADPLRAVVLCGPGNNGGDGFVVARLLANRGWQVGLFLYGDPDRLPPDARRNHDLWARLGPVTRLGYPQMTPAGRAALAQALSLPSQPALCVDALFGIGLARPLTGLAPMFDLLARPHSCPHSCPHPWRGPSDRRHVALDIPSGLEADNGEIPGDDPALAFHADLTVSFHAAKPGHLAGHGPALCGSLAVVDIGLPPGAK